MISAYKTVAKEATCEVLNQGSKFLGYIEKITSTEEAKEYILKLRKLHPYASHICYAYAYTDFGGKSLKTKSSDDGEPSGTAGKPILEVITKNNLANVIVCVVRYFGGTLLGASNLLRAYVNATQKVIENAEVIERKFVEELDLCIAYNEVSKVEKFLEDKGVSVLDTDFAEDVYFTVGIKLQDLEETLKQLNDLLNRKVEFEDKGSKFI